MLLLAVTAAVRSDFALGRNMEILVNLFREINLLYVDPVEADKLVEAAAEGMSSQLDPYTEYLPEEQMADFEIMTTGKYAGIGSLIRKKGDYVAISQPYKGFPADKAGLKAGDKILAINGQDIKGVESAEVSGLLRGDPGTTVKLKVEKFDTGRTEELSIRRERIKISGVPWYGYVQDGIGYISHTDFSEDCSNDMRKALGDLQRTGKLEGLVIDLRNNGGGILQEAVKILSFFVPKGTEVVSMRGRLPENNQVFKTESEPVAADLPIVVLVNSGSASAAEIVSGALQDLDRAVLMGQRTFGKGLVQSTRPVGYNSYLKITTAKYYIPSGRCIQAMDYSHRNPDGSVSHVPDSLVREFSTAAGRKVYDGGGIIPDIKIPAEYTSVFVMEVYGRGYIEDFVDGYVKANPAADTSLRNYTFGDYASFAEFMKDKRVDFESETRAALNLLKERAAKEQYMTRIEGAVEQIERDLPDDKAANLEIYRRDLTGLIEDEIVIRRYYMQGVIERNASRDKEVAAAAGLLRDPSRYRSLLGAAK